MAKAKKKAKKTGCICIQRYHDGGQKACYTEAGGFKFTKGKCKCPRYVGGKCKLKAKKR